MNILRETHLGYGFWLLSSTSSDLAEVLWMGIGKPQKVPRKSFSRETRWLGVPLLCAKEENSLYSCLLNGWEISVAWYYTPCICLGSQSSHWDTHWSVTLSPRDTEHLAQCHHYVSLAGLLDSVSLFSHLPKIKAKTHLQFQSMWKMDLIITFIGTMVEFINVPTVFL